MKKIIEVKFNSFLPKVQMIIDIPDDRETKEYIDNYLNNICGGIKWKLLEGGELKNVSEKLQDTVFYGV